MNHGDMVDVVSFNILISARLQLGNSVNARALIDKMEAEGPEPDNATYNELISVILYDRFCFVWVRVFFAFFGYVVRGDVPHARA